MADAKKQWTIETWLQAIGALAALIAIIVTVYFSIRSERIKELSVTVLSKRPLLSLESAGGKGELEVRLKGTPLAAPWLVAIKVQNTGGLSIEERDIESPLKLFFQGARPINAELQGRSDQAIAATVTYGDDFVTVGHKLLNPGDWISIDVFFEGEPKIPPIAAARISGVVSPRVFGPKANEDDSAKFNVLGLPSPVILIGLAATTLLGTAAVGVGVVALALFVRSLVRRGVESNEDSPPPVPKLVSKLGTVAPRTRTGKIIFSAIGAPNGLNLLRTENDIKTGLETIPKPILEALGLNVDSATELLRSELKDGLRRSIANTLYVILPPGKDRQASDLMESTNVAELDVDAILERGISIAKQFGASLDSRATSVDAMDLFGGIALLFLGATILAISAGGWVVAGFH